MKTVDDYERIRKAYYVEGIPGHTVTHLEWSVESSHWPPGPVRALDGLLDGLCRLTQLLLHQVGVSCSGRGANGGAANEDEGAVSG